MKYILFLAILIFGFLPQTANAATIIVPAGGNLQSAIYTAQSGDTIIVEAGAVYFNIRLPLKSGTEYITIQSSRASELPEGVRVGPAQAALFAKIQSAIPAEPAIQTEPGAHHYRFIGVEISTATASTVVYDLVRFGNGRQEQKTLDSVPHNLIIDRSWIHGFSTQDVQRGIALNSAETSVINSYISDIHGVGFEAQGIAGWNGPGPFRIINNYIEASTQGILFGGADSAVEALAPANVEVRRNHLFKPFSWKVGHPTYAGKHWTVKNILELKSAKNVVIDGNVMENNWTDGQDGKAILLTVRNQECSANWSTIQDVTFTNNTIMNAEGGLNLLGKDNEAEPSYGKCPAGSTSTRGNNVAINNNLFHNINGNFLTMNGFNNVNISRNTHVQQGNLTTLYGEVSNGFRYTNNLTWDHDYGIVGDGVSGGVVALDRFTPGWVVTGNTIVRPYDKLAYPAGNDYPDLLPFPAEWRSPIVGVGADIDALNAAQSGAVVLPSPTPTPTPTPVASPSPTPTPTPTPAPSPSPSPTPTPSPSPTPTPSPSPSPSPTPAPSPSPTPRCMRLNPKGKCVKWF